MKHFKNFDRHQAFGTEMMNFHSKTITEVQDWTMVYKEKRNTALSNMLCGVWDGYLYHTLLADAKELGLPKLILARIDYTVNYVETFINEMGETRTEI